MYKTGIKSDPSEVKTYPASRLRACLLLLTLFTVGVRAALPHDVALLVDKALPRWGSQEGVAAERGGSSVPDHRLTTIRQALVTTTQLVSL